MSALVTALLAVALAAAPKPAAPTIAGSAQPATGTPHTYVFTSAEPGVAASAFRYRCSLDSPALHPCGRRLTLRFAAGTHVLRVQAIDPAGRRSAISRLTIVAVEPVAQLAARQAWQVNIAGGNGGVDIPAVAVGPDGNVYAADAANDRILVYDAAGQFLRGWGSKGDGPGQFDFRKDTGEDLGFASIAVDGAGAVYVAEAERIQKFDSQGAYQLGWGTGGLGNGQFLRIISLATDAAGAVYTAEDRPKTLGRAQEFDGTGRFLTTFGRGQIVDTGGVAVDAAGRVLISDDIADTIDVFGADGRLIRKFGSPGNAPGRLNFPTGLALAGNTLYVADTDHARIVEFDVASGRAIGYWPTDQDTYSVAVDAAGAVYAVNTAGNLTKYLLPA